jgi:hypothetical protein
LFAFGCGFGLFALGVGLSLFSYWFIWVAPVQGSSYSSLPPQRKVGKRKRAQTTIFKVSISYSK